MSKWSRDGNRTGLFITRTPLARARRSRKNSLTCGNAPSGSGARVVGTPLVTLSSQCSGSDRLGNLDQQPA